MKYHPDRNPDSKTAEDKFKEVKKLTRCCPIRKNAKHMIAMVMLALDPNMGGGGGGHGGGFADAFGDIFGDIFGGGRRSSGSTGLSWCRFALQLGNLFGTSGEWFRYNHPHS